MCWPTRAQPVTCELKLSSGSCIYTNASIRLLLAFFLNKQSRRRCSDFHRLVYRRAASIFLPWYSRVICKIVQKRSTYTWPGLARGRTRLPKPSWASTLSSWNQAELGQHAFILEPSRAGTACFHLGTKPSATCVNISARAEPVPNPR